MTGALRSWVGGFFGEAVEVGLGIVVSVDSVDLELLSGGKHIDDVATLLGVEDEEFVSEKIKFVRVMNSYVDQ